MKKKILVVDDEPDVLSVLEKRLSEAGYSVVTVLGGREAFDKIKEEMPDLILLDIVMPGIDGVEIGKSLKNDPKTKDIPVIFLTCLFTKKDEEAMGRSAGGNIFIAKPYEPQELLKEIEKHLR